MAEHGECTVFKVAGYLVCQHFMQVLDEQIAREIKVAEKAGDVSEHYMLLRERVLLAHAPQVREGDR